MEEPLVEIFKQSFQVVGAALGGVQTLASAHLAHQVGLPADMMAGNVLAITGRGLAVNRPAVHLGQQDVGNGFQHGRGSAFQQVREAHQQFAFAHADGVLDAGEREEFHCQPRQGSVPGEGRGTTVQRFGERCASRPARLARALTAPSERSSFNASPASCAWPLPVRSTAGGGPARCCPGYRAHWRAGIRIARFPLSWRWRRLAGPATWPGIQCHLR